jgi:hypothetical protein
MFRQHELANQTGSSFNRFHIPGVRVVAPNCAVFSLHYVLVKEFMSNWMFQAFIYTLWHQQRFCTQHRCSWSYYIRQEQYMEQEMKTIWKRLNEGKTTQWPKEKGQKVQATIYKTLHIKLKIPTKNRRWTQVLRKGRQFLLH